MKDREHKFHRPNSRPLDSIIPMCLQYNAPFRQLGDRLDAEDDERAEPPYALHGWSTCHVRDGRAVANAETNVTYISVAEGHTEEQRT